MFVTCMYLPLFCIMNTNLSWWIYWFTLLSILIVTFACKYSDIKVFSLSAHPLFYNNLVPNKNSTSFTDSLVIISVQHIRPNWPCSFICNHQMKCSSTKLDIVNIWEMNLEHRSLCSNLLMLNDVYSTPPSIRPALYMPFFMHKEYNNINPSLFFSCLICCLKDTGYGVLWFCFIFITLAYLVTK